MRRAFRRDFGLISLVQPQRFWRAIALATPFVVVTPTLLAPQSAHAQVVVDPVNVAYPQPNNTLTGAAKLLFSGVPDGGHVGIYIDLTETNKVTAFRTATNQGTYNLDTSSLSDGPHTLTIISFSATGREVARRNVTFKVLNAGSAGVSEDSVRLINWSRQDVINPKVQRYRVFATSDATIVGDESTSGSSSSSSSGSDAEDKTIPAPLDKQVDLFIRRAVRDVGMINNSANIRLVVQEAFERGRKDSEQNSSSGSLRRKKQTYNGKAPWGNWLKAPENSQAYTKMITQDGREINATRKLASLPLGDLLPSFPNYRIQPGATWNSDILIVGELTKREPIRLREVPMSFSGLDNIQTPAGVERRSAKIEVATYNLPDHIALKIARALQTEAGGGGAGGTGVGASSNSGESEAELPEITISRADITRTIWFDIAANQLLRSEDTINAYYEEVATQGKDSANVSSSVLGSSEKSASVSAIPKSVTYNLRVVKFLDDRLPNPTNTWNGGAGTAHSRDSVRDPSIAKANGNLINNH